MSTLYCGINVVAHGTDELMRVTETRQNGSSTTFYAVERREAPNDIFDVTDDHHDRMLLTSLPTVHWDISMFVGERSVVFYGGDSQRLLVIPFSRLHSVVERTDADPSREKYLHADLFQRQRAGGTWGGEQQQQQGFYTEIELYVLREDFAVTRAKQRAFSNPALLDPLFAYEPESCFVLCASGPCGIALVAAIKAVKLRWDESLTRIACDIASDSDLSHREGMRIVPLVEYDRHVMLHSTQRVESLIEHEKHRSLRDTMAAAQNGGPEHVVGGRSGAAGHRLDTAVDLGTVFLADAGTASRGRQIRSPIQKQKQQHQRSMVTSSPPRSHLPLPPAALSGIQVMCTNCNRSIALETRGYHLAECSRNSIKK